MDPVVLLVVGDHVLKQLLGDEVIFSPGLLSIFGWTCCVWRATVKTHTHTGREMITVYLHMTCVHIKVTYGIHTRHWSLEGCWVESDQPFAHLVHSHTRSTYSTDGNRTSSPHLTS